MSIIGGYKIVDFKGVNLVTDADPVEIKNIYHKAQSLFVKRFVAANLVVDNQDYGETDLSSCKDTENGNLILTTGPIQITITPQSYVSVEPLSVAADVSWGDINGNIEDQEDLAEELDNIYTYIETAIQYPEINVDPSQYIDLSHIQFTEEQAAIIEDDNNRVVAFDGIVGHINRESDSINIILFGNASEVAIAYDQDTKIGEVEYVDLALASDIPAAVSGTNDGTNWTTITIGNTTKNIPAGGGGAVNSVNGETGDVVLTASDIYATNSQSIQDNLEQIDEAVEGVIDDLAEKQDTLTAGTGISIVNNVISATGTGAIQIFRTSTNVPLGQTGLEYTTAAPNVNPNSFAILDNTKKNQYAIETYGLRVVRTGNLSLTVGYDTIPTENLPFDYIIIN